MNKLTIILGIVLCLSSCASQSYEKAIADWIQTDADGTWTDLKFELMEVIGTKDITVSDSIQILKEKFKKKQAKNVTIYTQKINREKNSIALLEKSPYISKETIERHRGTLRKTENTLDSLINTSFQSVYDNREKTDILVRLLKCRYTIFLPMLKTKQEKIETFMLTPDMTKCLVRMKSIK